MAAAASNQDEAIVAINVTPLVDITLVLLIIFMVTAKIMVSQSIPLDLPKAATGGEAQVVFAVNIAQEGQVSVDGRVMASDEELRRAAASALAEHADLRTVLQASTAVSHGAVIHVLDELRSVGVQKIAFGVDPAVEGKRP